jgi:carboxypeptidase PM20D1
MRRILGSLLVVLIVVAVVLVVSSLRFASKQMHVEPVAPAAVDGAAAQRFAGSLRFPTISHQNPSRIDAEAFLALHRYLADNFPRVHAELSRETVAEYSLLYRWPGTDPTAAAIVLLAHLDVVPVVAGSEANWEYPPFAGQIADGYVWGRGAMDDKVGVLAILEAVEQLLSESFRPRATVYLAFGHDEEVGGHAGAERIAALLQDRGVRVHFVLDEGGVMFRGVVPGIVAPVAVIGVAEKGSVTLELAVHTAGGHSSSPPPQTAIGIVGAAVRNVEKNQMSSALGGATRAFFNYVGPEMPLAQRLLFANLWLFGALVESRLGNSPATNATLRTTTAVTMIEGGVKENVLPTSARAVVNFRILPGDSVQSVTDHVRRVVDDPRVQIRALPLSREPSSQAPVDSASFAMVQRTIHEVAPEAVVAPYLTLGGTDSRHFGRLTDEIYRFSPILGDAEDLERVHGTNERMSVENYEMCVRFFLQLLKNSQGLPAPASS